MQEVRNTNEETIAIQENSATETDIKATAESNTNEATISTQANTVLQEDNAIKDTISDEDNKLSDLDKREKELNQKEKEFAKRELETKLNDFFKSEGMGENIIKSFIEFY